MEKTKVGIVGLGTVGSGVARLLLDFGDRTARHAGRTLWLEQVVVRDVDKPRDCELPKGILSDDLSKITGNREITTVAHLVGGLEPARSIMIALLESGKDVITANKALLAEHGPELFDLARELGRSIAFEASVAGGIPIIANISQCLSANQIESLTAILNGTSNFILTQMEEQESDYASALDEAQRLGYAEADPTMDVGGFDAAHKLCLLAALAFGGAPNFAAAEVEGIEQIELVDIRLAHELGYRIKLIASASREAGGASVRVNPALTPLDHPLAQAGGSLNALFIEGRRIGRIYLQGPGAGAGPTAAAVAADIADVIAGASRPVFQGAAEGLSPLPPGDPQQRVGKAFLRLVVRDRPGVIAGVSEALAKAGVSIDSFLQRPVEDTGLVPIVLTTQPASEGAVRDAIDHIEALEAVVERPRMIRIARI
ncbi:MAG TPA: homoserine dehydrogenase [Caulobacteraceae bacterium]|nr:homoserine dehydrogenase [Caulobacteraceae bacterium]